MLIVWLGAAFLVGMIVGVALGLAFCPKVAVSLGLSAGAPQPKGDRK